MRVFLTGGTGYMGKALSSALLARGHTVRALVRESSVTKVAPGVVPVIGDVFDAPSWQHELRDADVLVHLVGVAKPSPRKAREFVEIDLRSAQSAFAAAQHANVAHVVYVSVAHPAPVMQSYIDARVQAEAALRTSGRPATVLRPWYVLGPGHWWPIALVPIYAIASWIPAMREGATRLGLVTLAEMIRALVAGIESPSNGYRIVDVPAIREAQLR